MIKPMLACKVNLDKLRFPVYASPKLDGIRCLVIGGKALTRALKPIPNKYIREMLESNAHCLEGFDGELVVGEPTEPNCFNKTSSAVMSFEGEPDFTFMVFDHLSTGVWEKRWIFDKMMNLNALPNFVVFAEQREVSDLEELLQLEEVYVNSGYEGVMLRDLSVSTSTVAAR